MGGCKRSTIDVMSLEKRAAPFTSQSRGGEISQRNGQGDHLVDPSRELEVQKCIMLREGYLARVTRLAEDMSRRDKRAKYHPQSLPAGLIDLLDLLRAATLDTIEAISLWRLSQATPAPAQFQWNGRNYLTKMLHDCDFLDRVEALRSWLGFRVSGNPFFFPEQSTLGDQDGSCSITQASSQPTGEGCKSDDNGTVDVGRQPWHGPLELEAPDGRGDAVGQGITCSQSSKKRRLQRTGAINTLAPYAAAVINDQSLLPKLRSPTRRGGADSARRQGSAAGAFGFQSKSRTVDTQNIVPNLVTRTDAQRINVARQTLAEEQALTRETATKLQREDEGRSNSRRGPSKAVDMNVRVPVRSTHETSPGQRLSDLGNWNLGREISTKQAAWMEPRDTASVLGEHSIPSLVRTSAGLLRRPPPEPHPALGAVLLQSDRPDGELHPNPFLHTVADDDVLQNGDLEEEVAIPTPRSMRSNTKDRCRTALIHDSSHRRRSRRDPNLSFGNRSSRPATALARIPSLSLHNQSSRFKQGISGCPGRVMERGFPAVGASYAGGAVPQENTERSYSTCSRRMRGLSRKAGAELRALTAAGTTGRRQPPLREERLRRLARDVVRYSMELRQLAVDEDRLRRSIARCASGSGQQSKYVDHSRGVPEVEPSDGDRDVAAMVSVGQHEGATQRIGIKPIGTRPPVHATKRMDQLLEEKRHEIDWKVFSLSIKRDELRCLRIVEKQERERKLALKLERRRVHLREGQKLPEDEAVADLLEDSCSMVVQKRVRGIAGRKYATWYKGNIQQAATTIQRGVRFIWDRRATRRRHLLNASARPMQATIRMFVARQRYKRLLRQRRELVACCKIQVAGRGMLGRRRVASRRLMIAAATKALGWVSLERLQPRHLKELAHAIHGALVDPVRQFPPAGVLGALRAVLTILDDASEKIDHKEDKNANSIAGPACYGNASNLNTVTFRTALGRTVESTVSAPDLTWEMAARVLGRPFRLLRRMRAFASGLGASSDASPARLIHLSPDAARLLSAYRFDPSWSSESLCSMVLGCTAAKALVGWATELEKVYREQPRVENFLRDAQPAWLRKARSFQKRRRALELHAESCRQALKVAKEYCQQLESQGRAYGDPMLASELLERQCEEIGDAIRELEEKRSAFLEVQAGVEEAAGKVLRDNVEFAEREASVAAREETMAIRLGQSEPEELEDLAGKTRDCGVVVRELLRRVRVWERRRKEENRPLLEEWIPPTEGQKLMSRALGEVRAWKQIIVVQKARLVEDAGGRRFVKGLTGKDMQAWRSATEGLDACRADIDSRQAGLAEDVRQFELELSRRNAEIAAEKVSSAPWDNATEETRALEKQEDADAAREEIRTAMGATLPAGMLGTAAEPPMCSGHPARGRFSQRPTLLLVGLDLPASIRNGIRASLDRDAPGLFDHHIVGAGALPSLAAQATASRAFLGPCREQPARATKPPWVQSKPRVHPTNGSNKLDSDTSGDNTELDRSRSTSDKGVGSKDRTVLGQDPAVAKSRANVVQSVLSAGRNVSLEVVPGPGLWARGRFLRDLEALLEGLDDGDCEGKGSGPTVVLIDGHGQNRSGGGSEVSHGTNFAKQTAHLKEYIAGGVGADRSQVQRLERALPPASLAARRLKCLMEEAAQCLHDLSSIHGEAPWPFKAITLGSGACILHGTPKGVHQRQQRLHGAESPRESGTSRRSDIQTNRQNLPVSATYRGIDLLLAACHILLHPDRRYYVGEGQAWREEEGPLIRANTTEAAARHVSSPSNEDANDEKTAYLTYASRLAATGRKEVAETCSPGRLAEVLRRIDVESMPLEAAVALRHLSNHQDWPTTSARSDFIGCPVSEAFMAWIIAAVAAGTQLALEGGGGILKADERLPHHPSGDTAEDAALRSKRSEMPASAISVPSNTEKDGCDIPQPLMDALAERQQEQVLLKGLEKSLIDETVTVLDDDSSQFVPSTTAERDGRVQVRYQCKASAVLNEIMKIALRPFKVFEAVDCKIALSTTSPHVKHVKAAPPRSASRTLERPRGGPTIIARENEMASDEMGGDTFCVTLSRAFGSVYARAVSLGTGRMSRGHTMIARTRDEDMISLLSPNWMEKHDLSALRELRNEPAVWRALANTLALSYPDEAYESTHGNQPPPVHTLHHKEYRIASSTSTHRGDGQRRTTLEAPGAAESEHGSVGNSTRCEDGGKAGVLLFQHERRLTLETSCLLMGRVVPVSIYEESRSDFWCEAQVPAALTSAGKVACRTAMRVPKECIPLILEDDHPMRMQTILDASDLRQLSVLIADRLKLCRLGFARKGLRSYRHWLEDAIGGDKQPRESDALTGFLGTEKTIKDRSCPEFQLSLRKRSVGQVVFSRLVSFWVLCPSHRSLDEANGSDPCIQSTHDDIPGDSGPSQALGRYLVQRLVIVKEFSHRGECGELRGEAHYLGSEGPAQSFVLKPQITSMLLRGWREESKMREKKKTRRTSLRYWRDALTWRFRAVVQPAFFVGSRTMKRNQSGLLPSSRTATGSSFMIDGEPIVRVAVDERAPLFCLRRVAARLATRPEDAEERRDTAPATCNNHFDVLVLPAHPSAGSDGTNTTRSQRPMIELVATNLQTTGIFSFSVPIKSFTRELDAFLAACLTAPTSLSTELELPTPNVVLHDLARNWLLYSPGEEGNGSRTVLTLSFSQTAPIRAEPNVGLRGTRRHNTMLRGGGVYDRQGTLAEENGVRKMMGRESPLGADEPASAATCQTTRVGANEDAKRRTLRGSISTVQVERRNEGMVFRRRLVVPQRREHVKQHDIHGPSRERSQLERNQRGADEEAPKVLSISVYETFTAGSSGKIERYLKFFAHDETVRPAIEGVSTVPWVGTCEGVEGGILWRLVTQGLSFEYTRDPTGKRVGICLKVSAEQTFGNLTVSNDTDDLERLSFDERASTQSGVTRSSEKGEMEGLGRKESATKVGGAAGFSGENLPNADDCALNLGHKNDDRLLPCGDGMQVTGNALLSKDSHFAPAVCPHGQTDAPAGREDCTDLVMLEMPEEGRERGGEGGTGITSFDQPNKVYTGWHRITGVRLHVQCFQEVKCCRKEMHGKQDAGNADSLASSKWRPAGRGGVLGFPPDAFLRFILCDPGTGYRTGVRLSVGDVRKNLSTVDGTVDAELLDPGRRPALAKAVAQNLRLAFEADGGYRVILPLPANWRLA